jgi:hypothetical protein
VRGEGLLARQASDPALRCPLAVALVAFLSLAGCLGVGPDEVCSRPQVSLAWVPGDTQGAGVLSEPTDPDQDWDALFSIQTTATVELNVATWPAGWNLDAARLGSTNSSLYRARLTPTRLPQAGAFNVEWASTHDGECYEMVRSSSVTLAEPSPGSVASVGQGAMVYTAGFWENGTLFYTNMPDVDRSVWPRAGWYAWEGGDALPVYVYGSSRDEEPAYWSACPPSPPSDGSCAWNYFTTIEGFNEALKGLSTNTARVVHIPPEKAYTLPGREDHPLYGDALVFYIRLVAVHDVPCGPDEPPALCQMPAP